VKRRTLWTAGFLTLTAGAVAMELVAANDSDPDTVTWTEMISAWVPQTVTFAAIGILVSWVGPHFTAAYRSRGTDRGEPMITRSGLRWLKADAANRAWRTVLQGMAVAVLSAAGDAVLQVLQRAVAEGATSHRFDWHQVATTATYAAGTAALMAVVAYLHRLKVDPSPMPSAEPPAPPPSPPAPPATEPMEPEPRLFAQKVKLTPADPIRREY
jgi:hypothetical protein